ncbi:hypothetical protein DICPUDRAFT_155103 [Dictyostelium purpureum]|uniref:Peptidase C1A papain C-terminal domain-containing protein n=1 Tax=Dictyostelium purpureum TaxID=5786 RepID=F0ZT30_DICPU|nr:uncharacterized protein DICPUDRAFT_155103 [Dictyostelium purpureum]EGC32888.1 hypothetical protein DICPUDRAFT_155103 [Dictyostelium purpureum]|eukprot:XP_003290573.1 hypothetical protein DICPUDRAFT_155103 [Dictyostelium purpureum]
MRVLFALVVVFLLLNVVFSVKIDIRPPHHIHKRIQHDTWVEEKNDQFDNIKIGSLLGFKKSLNRPSIPVLNADPNIKAPASFDSRTAWSNCTTIGYIENQARCGSCWAFGAVESAQDRICIHKGLDVQLSFLDLVTCDQSDDGCEGGDDVSAWNFLKKQGVVTQECKPYTIPTCPPAQQPCLNFVNTPNCVKQCESNSTLIYSQDKHKMAKIYSINSVEAIMQEISTNGPVEACFSVYEDFLGYKSGVYQHTTGKFLGGHCVKIFGYGTLNGVNYWSVANSWTTSWGDNGIFLIKRGSDECGIEDEVVAGIPL